MCNIMEGKFAWIYNFLVHEDYHHEAEEYNKNTMCAIYKYQIGIMFGLNIHLVNVKL